MPQKSKSKTIKNITGCRKLLDILFVQVSGLYGIPCTDNLQSFCFVVVAGMVGQIRESVSNPFVLHALKYLSVTCESHPLQKKMMFHIALQQHIFHVTVNVTFGTTKASHIPSKQRKKLPFKGIRM